MRQFMRKPPSGQARKAALQALRLDAAADATSLRCIPRGAHCLARIIAKSSFVLCGVVEADAIFRSMKVSARWACPEGKRVREGSVVCRLSGECRRILACERTALNYLMLLSGVATKSAEAAERYGKWKIAATRKAIPLLSASEKRAVMVGGCLTHRLGLADGILVKDNHIAAMARLHGSSRESAIREVVLSFPKGAFVEVEASSLSEAAAAAEAGAKAVLVDNASPQALRRIASAIRRISPGIIIEASGGITLRNAGRYLRAGADFCSTSELTMRIEPADLSLEIDF